MGKEKEEFFRRICPQNAAKWDEVAERGRRVIPEYRIKAWEK